MSARELPPLPRVDYQYPTAGDRNGCIAIIGEAPGNEEVRQGIPFAGMSGRLLNRNLEQVGLDRNACLVANVFRFQPPGNKVGHFFCSRTRARKESLSLAEELGPFGTSDYCIADYRGEVEALRRTLEDIRPKAILALGRTPTWALTGQNGITRLRGQVLPCRFLPEIPVVPTWHPSYILRGNWSEEATFRSDIELARRCAEGPVPPDRALDPVA